jgi:hypothetical protein
MTVADSTHVSTVVAALTPVGYLIALAIVFSTFGVIGYRSVIALAARGPDDKGVDVAWALLKTFPTTPGRIIAELALAAFYVVGCMVADMIGHPVSEGTQNTLGLFVAAMLGIGAGQFVGKRATDAEYQRAKNANAPTPPPTTIIADNANVSGSPVTVEDNKK